MRTLHCKFWVLFISSLLLFIGFVSHATAQTRLNRIDSISWQSLIGNAYYTKSMTGSRTTEYFQFVTYDQNWSGYSGRLELLGPSENITSRSHLIDFLSTRIFHGECMKVMTDPMLVQDIYQISQTFFSFEIDRGRYIICRRT